ncbi:hypothetical protein D3C75_1175630 [compost metagenome]
MYTQFSTIKIYWLLWLIEVDLGTASIREWNCSSNAVCVAFGSVFNVRWNDLSLICNHCKHFCTHHHLTDRA